MAQNHNLSNCQLLSLSECKFAHLKALEMRMRKLLLDLSVAQILPEKINKIFLPKELGFIDVLSTVGAEKTQ